MEEGRSEKIKKAFLIFKAKMSDIGKRQLILLDKIDKIVSKEKADKIRENIKKN